MNTPPFEERATIAEAARRAGVHPNTVRRLIRTGRIRAELTRGRHGDTWIVDAAALRRMVSQPRGGAPEAVSDSRDDSVSSRLVTGVDLSLDRARALERYTHGLSLIHI